LNKKIALGFVFFVTLVITLMLASLFAYQYQKVEQEEFATEVLDSAETVTSQLISVLSASSKLTDFKCTSENINKLRQLVLLNTEVFDLGYMIDGSALCTANWGIIKPTKLIAKDESEFNGYHFYSNESNLYQFSQHYNVTQQGDFFAVNITTPYSQQIKRLPKYQFQIYSQRADYVFDEYIPPQNLESLFSLKLETTVCSEKYRYCVRTNNSNAGLSSYSVQAKFIIFLVILTFCYLVTHLTKLLMDSNQSIESRFRKALKNRSLFMEYQPLVTIQGAEIEAVESLVRWTDEVHGKVSPELFISIAEKLSLYPKLAHFTARRSIEDMAPILRENRHFYLGINVASYEVLNEQFLVFLDKLTHDNHVEPRQIKIEITEKINVTLAELAHFSKKARALGFMVVLDDFGTGVANLIWLTEIHFDFIKIDRVFVNALNFDVKKGMASAVMEMVAGLGKPVVFEGVETDKEYKMIQQYSLIGYVQGWLFYPSLPLKELLPVLRREKSVRLKKSV